jgi:hypothetical protein
MCPFTRASVRELKRLNAEKREWYSRPEKRDVLDTEIDGTIEILARLNREGRQFAREHPHLAA